MGKEEVKKVMQKGWKTLANRNYGSKMRKSANHDLKESQH